MVFLYLHRLSFTLRVLLMALLALQLPVTTLSEDSTPGCSAPGTHRLHYQGTELLPFRCSESVIKTANFRRLQNSKILSSKIKKLTTTSASHALPLKSPSYHPPMHKARQQWMGSHPYTQGTTGKLFSFSIAS